MDKERIEMHAMSGGNCVTTSILALLPHNFEESTYEALHDNSLALEGMAAMTGLELDRTGIMLCGIPMGETDHPSHFFNRISREIRHGDEEGTFLGGLMLTDDLLIDIRNQRIITHVVGIKAIHEAKRKKATVIDTFNKTNHPMHIVRQVPLTWLDRRMMKEETKKRIWELSLLDECPIGATAMAFVGLPKKDINPELDYLQIMYDGLIEQQLLLRDVMIREGRGEWLEGDDGIWQEYMEGILD